MPIRCHAVEVTTDGAGAATVYSQAINGALLEIQYVKPGSGGFDDGSTMTVTGDTTGRAIWSESNVNASAVRSPRQACHSVAGAALVYAVGAPVTDLIYLAERVKIVIASGGAAANAKFHLITDEGE